MFTKSYAAIYMVLSHLASLAVAGPLEKRQQSATLSFFSPDSSCQGASENTLQMFEQNSCVTFSESATSYSFDANSQVATLQLFTGGGCGQAVQQVTGSPVCVSPGTDITGVQWHLGQ
jgi:hypothetical protein